MRYLASVAREEIDALVARAQDGDVRAFEALVDGHLPAVRRFARAFAAADGDADDLAQEALVRVHQHLRAFRFQAAFSTWLFAVVRSAFLDRVRGREARRRALTEPLRADHAEREGGQRPDDAALSEEERRRVWDALRRIPADFRTAIVLFDIEGRSYDEVAAVEGVAVGTVKSRLHRGRAALRRLLGEARTGTPAARTPSHLRGAR